VVTGRVERGKVKVGEEIEIVGFKATEKKVVTGVRCSASCSMRGWRGTTSGCCCAGGKDGRGAGAGAGQPGRSSRTPSSRARCTSCRRKRGAAHAVLNGYRPQFYIRTTDVTGILKLPDGVEMVMPGDNTPITGELITPVALEKGARFAIREGGRTVGAGTSRDIGVGVRD